MTDGWKYTLTGFGEFLEMRGVAFAEPMPATRLCGVPRGKDRCCPFDGKKFADSDVHPMSIERGELEQRRIVCAAGSLAGSQVCGFSGKLSELADHLTRCGSAGDQVRKVPATRLSQSRGGSLPQVHRTVVCGECRNRR
ncbi:hypothetical protein MTO96_050018 [Rhipicephalus appendiculatus]